MSTVEAFAKELHKKYKLDNFIIKGDLMPKIQKMPTLAFGMDYPLFGGLPYKCICEYSGLPHSGKTTAACCELAAYQKAHPNRPCFYIDAEHRLDMDFQARMNGVDWSKVNMVNIPAGMSGEEVLEIITQIEQDIDDVGMIILDSVPALIPKAILESDLTKDNGMQGTLAKRLYPFMNEMQALLAEKGNIFIVINQVRDGGMLNGVQLWKEPCGYALQFLSTVMVRFGKRKFTLEDNMDACGSKNGEGSDGFRLMFKITKNSTANPTRGGGFITYRYETGIDWLNDLVEIAEKFDFIKKSGSWRTLVNCFTGEVYTDAEGQPLKGYMKDLKQYINDHEDFKNEYVKMLQDYISSSGKSFGSLLDKETSSAIDAEDESATKSK